MALWLYLMVMIDNSSLFCLYIFVLEDLTFFPTVNHKAYLSYKHTYLDTGVFEIITYEAQFLLSKYVFAKCGLLLPKLLPPLLPLALPEFLANADKQTKRSNYR